MLVGMTSVENDTCWCGCGQHPVGPKSRFCQGHDQKAVGKIKAAVRSNRISDLSPELQQYGRERDFFS